MYGVSCLWFFLLLLASQCSIFQRQPLPPSNTRRVLLSKKSSYETGHVRDLNKKKSNPRISRHRPLRYLTSMLTVTAPSLTQLFLKVLARSEVTVNARSSEGYSFTAAILQWLSDNMSSADVKWKNTTFA
ncbi:hypothetical protein K443DRAFT_296332 [Laccaria amethystina LaAM-08-1]|uniref:Unplaced genomic scaffold K443scaffold_198, whole genome shotgun sequence n=1 Tax=Laccaria amethystina LaAM-08-1 TaxID=1095629 RepID=A0A0C9XEI8_9AGAR|nr:hypothetical protein K443DRAFT_296332 [Laccaria amethystina LaAM-08-1]